MTRHGRYTGRWQRIFAAAVAVSSFILHPSSFLGAPPAPVEAIAGRPFGVGRIEVDLPPALLPEPLGLAGLGLSAAKGRILYPAVDIPVLGEAVKTILGQTDRPLARIIGGLLDRPPRATVYFLFQGDEPLALTLQSRVGRTLTLTPVNDPVRHGRLTAAWWRAYTRTPLFFLHRSDYPPMVENYLQVMLSKRLGLPPPAPPPDNPLSSTLGRELGLVLDTESLRVAMRRDRMLGHAHLGEPATEPLPPPLPEVQLQIPDLPADVKVEPIALRVPSECFYVRFGSFTNFVWFQDTLARWGGDLSNLVAQRGLNYGLSQRMQRQLVLQLNALSRLMGEATVRDAAIVGSDMYLSDGAAIGILFHARNNLLLAADFARQRQEAILATPGTTETKLTIDGHPVSLISSPDGVIRSYYVADGDFHFVTTSEALVRRFLQTAAGTGALGASQEFRYARTLMPLERNDTVFVYLSAAFFRNMVRPQYRIETMRRLQAAADIELVQLARLAAASEGKPGGTFSELIGEGFLAADFGPRPDGSATQMDHGRVYDSLRGQRGGFLPVPDVTMQGVTRSEAEEYARFMDDYEKSVGQVDPVFIGMRRELAVDGKREHVVIDAQMSPLNPRRYEVLKTMLGAAEPSELAPIPGDTISGEAVFKQQRAFVGLRDRGPLPDGQRLGLLGADGQPRPLGELFYGYWGYTGPDAGLLELFNRQIVTPPDLAGYSRSRNELWRQQLGEFTVFSLHHDVLATVTPQLRFQAASRPAQFRLHVGDLTQTRIAPLANDLALARSRQTALGNLRLLHAMGQQLHVPGEDAKMAAELLLGAELICPLGGTLVYRKAPDGADHWTSTVLEQTASHGATLTESPAGFQPPPLNWFRGLQADANCMEGRLTAHVEVDMELPGK